MRVVFARETASSVRVTVWEGTRRTFDQSGKATGNAFQTKVLNKVPIDLDTFFRSLPENVGDPEITLTVGEVEVEKPFYIAVRSLLAPSETETPYSAVSPAEALSLVLTDTASPLAEPVLAWDGKERLAVLDIDYHHMPLGSRLTEAQLLDYARKVKPYPVAFHTSHGRGLKLFYVAAGGFTAEELAAVAAVCFRSIDGRATAEIKRESRHPGYSRTVDDVEQRCSEVHFSDGTTDLSTVARWLGSGVPDDERDEYIASRGWRKGVRYDHSHCPIRGFLDSHGTPVYIGDFGIFCDKCSNEGVAAAYRSKPGLMPWSAILHSADNRLSGMLRAFTHWAHARLILSYLLGEMPETISRRAYTAALKMLHGLDDPRIPLVFSASNLVLVDNNWLASENRTALKESQSGRGQVESLPACKKIEGRNGVLTVKTDHQALSELIHQNTIKTERGYESLMPIRGARIWGEFLPYPDNRVPFLIPNVAIEPGRRPKYIPRARRGDVGEAWKLFELACPGMSRKYVELLIVAKGFAEGKQTVPKIIVAGPAGAGKTGQVDLAASIVGDGAEAATWCRSEERFRQQVMAATRKGDIVRVDEVFKSADEHKISPRDALNPLLTLDDNTMGHVLYEGPRTVGRKFVVVLTDIVVPMQVQEDLQLARRLTYVWLPDRVPEWKATLAAAGVSDLKSFRLSGSPPQFAEAADVILSDVIDRFFRQPTTWDAAAASLGFESLENSKDFADRKELLDEFRLALLAAPTVDDGRYKGSCGWKLIRRDFRDGDRLSELYLDFADNKNDKWATSRRLAEVGWGKYFGVLSSVRLDMRPYRDNMIYVRFAVGDHAQPEMVNEQIR